MNQSALIIADFMPENLPDIQSIDHQDIDLKKLVRQSKDAALPITYFVPVNDPKAIFSSMLKKIKEIRAAGGVVKNGDGDYLFIHRLGKWDLPKGKVDEGEQMKEAAIREVQEECGIKVDYLGPKVTTTYHVYPIKGVPVLKKTNWYEMGVNKVPRLKPQLEEDITEAIWLAKDKFNKIRKNTYPLIADILDRL